MSCSRNRVVRSLLGKLGAPTLIVHGTEDPLFPFGNALALEKEIPGARLLALERVGHEMPPRALWDVVVPTILGHTSSAPRADPEEAPMPPARYPGRRHETLHGFCCRWRKRARKRTELLRRHPLDAGVLREGIDRWSVT